MLKSYIITAFRNLRHGKGYTTINVLSFAAGLACCTILALYVRHELSYDRFHARSDNIFRLLSERDGPFGGRRTTTPAGLAAALPETFPEVLAATGISGFRTSYVSSSDKKHPAQGFYFADSSFFDVFSFPLVEGDPETALDRPDAMIVADDMAQFFFPDESPIGRTLSVGSWNWTITGVADVPANSHFRFRFLARAPFAAPDDGIKWQDDVNVVYLVAHDAAAAEGLVEKLNALAVDKDHGPGTYLKFSIQRLTDIHLRSHLEREFEANGDIRYVYLLATLGLLLLVVAVINFVNISTARYGRRALEVGVRKVLGAHRAQLIRQFIGESMMVTLLAGMLAFVLVLLMLPFVSSFTGKDLQLRASDGTYFVMLVTMLGILSGSYPAFFLSQFRPVAVLKGVFATGRGDLFLRRTLIGLQLFATVALATGAAVIYLQLRHLQEVRLGFDRDHVLVVDGWTGIGAHYDAFKEELLRESFVSSVTTGYRPGQSSGGAMMKEEGGEDFWLLHRSSAGYDYIETLGLRLLTGRGFSAEHPADSLNAVILSASAVRKLGMEEPVIGQTLDIPGSNRGKEVIGIVEDYNVLSYREAAAPVMITFGGDNVLIKLRPGNLRESLRRIEEIYAGFMPDHPIMYSFLDDEYDALFREERRFGMLFSVFSLVAVLVAFLGLAGLAAYAAERRTREIGIRKVLGAGMASIVRLLAAEFVWLVLLASALAVPLANTVASGWLEDFAFRVEVGPVLLLGVVIAALLLVLMAVVIQAVRAGQRNPVKSLRSE